MTYVIPSDKAKQIELLANYRACARRRVNGHRHFCHESFCRPHFVRIILMLRKAIRERGRIFYSAGDFMGTFIHNLVP